MATVALAIAPFFGPALAAARPDVWAAVGVHPNDIGHLDDHCLCEIEQLSQQPRVVAIGEIGLDYHWNTFPRQQQIDGFVRQLQLAQRLHLPVIIHCRDAYDDLMETLDEIDPIDGERRVAVLLHSFAGKPAHARAAIAKGYFLGIGGPLTYKNAHTLRDIVRATPLAHIVLETDAPDIPPQWLYLTAEQRAAGARSRNEPAELPRIAETLAALRGWTLAETAAVTCANARRVLPKLAPC